uniref:Deoxyribosyltransferase n=1 Tax=Siphoviridae sp. ctEP635 TaxID=2825396 RepID=A0A8S5UWX0_9CAUD|nr:MAG TPA: deoxyribosyltransferase [Siphoviridae sp. ctEP635]
MTKYEVHSPDPQPYHEKHKPGKRVYIAGRITGVPLFKLSFSIAAFTLVFRGYEPVNHASIDFGPDETEKATWEDYMRACLPMLATCDYIYLLPGWEDSRGARLEKQIADALGIKEVPTPSK